jgi:hypothetical protein
MRKHRPKPQAAAWAVILERGCSESWIAKVDKLEALKAWRSPCRKWLASDSDFGIVAAPMREGSVNMRTAYIGQLEDLPEAIIQISAYLSECVGSGKRISFAQGGVLSAETQEIIRQTLGTLPGPWAFN